MHDAFVALGRAREDGEVLLRPAARRQRHVGMAGTRDEHLRDGGEEELQPGAERAALDGVGHEVVVDEEQAARASGVRQHAARPAAREEGAREVPGLVHGDELQRGVVERPARVKRLAAELAERVRKAVLHHGQVFHVQPVRPVQVEYRQRSDHAQPPFMRSAALYFPVMSTFLGMHAAHVGPSGSPHAHSMAYSPHKRKCDFHRPGKAFENSADEVFAAREVPVRTPEIWYTIVIGKPTRNQDEETFWNCGDGGAVGGCG